MLGRLTSSSSSTQSSATTTSSATGAGGGSSMTSSSASSQASSSGSPSLASRASTATASLNQPKPKLNHPSSATFTNLSTPTEARSSTDAINPIQASSQGSPLASGSPLPSSVVKNINENSNSTTTKPKEEEVCMICTDHLQPSHTPTPAAPNSAGTTANPTPFLFKTPCCSQPFHLDCLFLWRLRKPTCPHCRHPMASETAACGCVMEKLARKLSSVVEGRTVGHVSEDSDDSEDDQARRRMHSGDGHSNIMQHMVDSLLPTFQEMMGGGYDRNPFGLDDEYDEDDDDEGDYDDWHDEDESDDYDDDDDDDGEEEENGNVGHHFGPPVIVHNTQNSINLQLYNNMAHAPNWLSTLKCPTCNHSFTSRQSLEQHLKTTRAHLVHVCCGRVFANVSGLLMHRQSDSHVHYQLLHRAAAESIAAGRAHQLSAGPPPLVDVTDSEGGSDDNHEYDDDDDDEVEEEKDEEDEEDEDDEEREEVEDEEKDYEDHEDATDERQDNTFNHHFAMDRYMGSPQNTVDLNEYAKLPSYTHPDWYKSKSCPYCKLTFSSTNALQQHLRTVRRHQVLTCCGRVFLDGISLHSHHNSIHNIDFID